eukprot:gene13973-19916_t
MLEVQTQSRSHCSIAKCATVQPHNARYPLSKCFPTKPSLSSGRHFNPDPDPDRETRATESSGTCRWHVTPLTSLSPDLDFSLNPSRAGPLPTRQPTSGSRAVRLMPQVAHTNKPRQLAAPTISLDGHPLDAARTWWTSVSGGSDAYMSQLLTHFSTFPELPTIPSIPFVDEVFEAAVSQEGEDFASKAAADITPYLSSIGVWEMKHIRRLSAMCDLSYRMHLVTADGISRRFGYSLVATARTPENHTFERTKSSEEVAAESDGMGVCLTIHSVIPPGKDSSASPVPYQLKDGLSCPSEWFVVDEVSTLTRTFVIQGSDSMDHWKMNVAFDPVVFEDPSLGVKVHRGAYMAAEALYARFLPLVAEHLELSPFARVSFTGHSIGGSLATLLLIMFSLRGLLKEHNVSNVYTFGAPAVFHEAAPACAVKKGPTKLLSHAGLVEQHIRNVILANDFAPKATSCDYSPVANILTRLNSGFKGHVSLKQDGRKHLYYFLGRMIVMQAHSDLTFVRGDKPHPMLPPGPGVYKLAPPSPKASPPTTSTSPSTTPTSPPTTSTSPPTASTSRPCLSPTPSQRRPLGSGASDETRPTSGLVESTSGLTIYSLEAGTASLGPIEDSHLPLPQGKEMHDPQSPTPRAPYVPASITEAVFALMDSPHPLKVLADPASYGPDGSVSRYHNPTSYTQALKRAVQHKRKEEMQSNNFGWLSSKPPWRPQPPAPASDLPRNVDPLAWESSDDVDGAWFYLIHPELLYPDY